jgi:hypothetical protein
MKTALVHDVAHHLGGRNGREEAWRCDRVCRRVGVIEVSTSATEVGQERNNTVSIKHVGSTLTTDQAMGCDRGTEKVTTECRHVAGDRGRKHTGVNQACRPH